MAGVNATGLSGLRDWIGRSDRGEDVVSEFPVQGMAALLDRAAVPGSLPPLWHWLYFKPVAAQALIDADGHPRRGGFLPPVSLPRRMWAGSRLTFRAPVPVGARLVRQSTIQDVVVKQGRQGDFVLLSLRHELTRDGQPVIDEAQDIVYRPAAPAASAAEAAAPAGDPPADVRDEWLPDAVQLFRYSALTFNAHRIHYDRPYTEQVEGYPGLVVQGPFTATRLLERFTPLFDAPLREFEFRAVSPLFAGNPVHLGCRQTATGTYDLWAATAEGRLAMTAKALLTTAA